MVGATVVVVVGATVVVVVPPATVTVVDAVLLDTSASEVGSTRVTVSTWAPAGADVKVMTGPNVWPAFSTLLSHPLEATNSTMPGEWVTVGRVSHPEKLTEGVPSAVGKENVHASLVAPLPLKNATPAVAWNVSPVTTLAGAETVTSRSESAEAASTDPTPESMKNTSDTAATWARDGLSRNIRRGMNVMSRKGGTNAISTMETPLFLSESVRSVRNISCLVLLCEIWNFSYCIDRTRQHAEWHYEDRRGD